MTLVGAAWPHTRIERVDVFEKSGVMKRNKNSSFIMHVSFKTAILNI